MVRDDGPPTDDQKPDSGLTPRASALDVLPEELPTSDSLPEQVDPSLRFDLRFENGGAVLALEDVAVADGFRIEKALFSVPDVQFPLDVSRGPELFRNRRLSVRALEVEFDYSMLFSAAKLRAAGLSLLRYRSRSGGIEFLFSIEGPTSPIVLRARGIFSPVGNADIAFVLHEVLPFGRAPKSRIDLARDLLDALDLPGGKPAYGMVRKADCFRWAIGQLLPRHGWKLPQYTDLQLQEVVCEKKSIKLRAWSHAEPEGWVRTQSIDPSPLDKAVGIAIFVEQMESSSPDLNPIDAVDAILDEGDPPPAVAPFAAEILRADPRRCFEGDEIVDRGLTAFPADLGLLSAHAEETGLSSEEWRNRLCRLASAALRSDEPWVAVGAYLAAAKSALTDGMLEAAIEMATHAWHADPAQGESGMLLSNLHQRQENWVEALRVGREALPRIHQDDASEFAVNLAKVATRLNDVDRARRLYRRALRKVENIDALLGLTELEIGEKNTKSAAALLTRLLAVDTEERPAQIRCEIQVLAGKLAAAGSDMDTALFHWGQARHLDPSSERVAQLFADAHASSGQYNKAIDVLRSFATTDPPSAPSIELMARFYFGRGETGDAQQCRNLLSRIEIADWTGQTRRLDAKAAYALGDSLPLLHTLLADAKGNEDENLEVSIYLEALDLARDLGETDLIAQALVGILQSRADAMDKVLDYLSGLEEQSVELKTFANQLQNVSVPASRVSVLASGLASEGRLRDAHNLLACLEDIDSRLERADLAGQTGLHREELNERKELALYLSEDAEDIASALVRAQYIRIAELHLTEVGDGAAAAASAYAAAAHRGESIQSDWLAAAVQGGQPRQIFESLRFDSSLLATVDPEILRKVCAEETIYLDDEEIQFRITMRRELADRTNLIRDVEDYLQDVRKNIDAPLAAKVFREMSLMHQQPSWLVEAANTIVFLGDPEAGLQTIVNELNGPLGRQTMVAEAAFELAKKHGDVDSIWKTSNHLLSLLDIDPVFRNLVHSMRAEVLLERDPAEGARALKSWLKDEPGASEALQLLVPHLVEQDIFDVAVSSLDRAINSGNASDEIEALAAMVAIGAAERNHRAIEKEAQELRLRCSKNEEGESRVVVLQSLLGLYDSAAEANGVIRVLNLLAECQVAPRAKADCFRQLAAVASEVVGDVDMAIRAWKGALLHIPNDVETSALLRGALKAKQDWDGLVDELVRGSKYAQSNEDRIALLLKAGDVTAGELGDHSRAARMWLGALRTKPFSDAALQRLLEESRRQDSLKLRVQSFISAGRTIGTGAKAADYFCEAAAILGGVLDKPRSAIAVYERASRAHLSSIEALYALIELFRSLNEPEGALKSIERLLPQLDSNEKAFSLEIRADIYENLLDDAEKAAESRHAVLELEPGQRVSALALERHYRRRGDVRQAINVRLALVECDNQMERKAQSLAFLSESAAQELEDLELAQELADAALFINPKLQHVRLSRVGYLEKLRQYQQMADELKTLLQTGVFEATERNVLARRMATVQSDVFLDYRAAASTIKDELERALEDRIGWDVLLKELVTLYERNGDWVEAYRGIQLFSERMPNGNELWGSRVKLLQKLAEAAENCGEKVESLACLREAHSLGALNRGSLLRWARLAEGAGQSAEAVEPFRLLVEDGYSDAEDLIGLLGRLGKAEEAAGHLEEALSAWIRRAERRPGDAQSQLNVERISKLLDVPHLTRPAAEVLVRLDAGKDPEQFSRFLWLARDTLQRLGNPSESLELYERARSISDDAGIRREMLDCAEAAADTTTSLALLERMQQAGDTLKRGDWIRLAETRAFIEHRYQVAFDNLFEAIGESEVLEPREEVLVSFICEKESSVIARALLAETREGEGLLMLENSPKLKALYDALCVAAEAPDEFLIPMADRFPENPAFALEAARKERQDAPLRAADRLLSSFDAGGTTNAELAEIALEMAADILCNDGIPNADVLTRLEPIWEQAASNARNRSALLRILRDVEEWEKVAHLFEISLPHENEREREIRLELAYVYREILEQPRKAVEHLDLILVGDESDREAWGELFECLEELADVRRLIHRIEDRVRIVSGLERRELVRKRTRLLLELGEGPDALDLLRDARIEAPLDRELRDYEWQIRERQGPEAFAEFLMRELGHEEEISVAKAILAIERQMVSAEARAQAYLILVNQDAKTIKETVLEILKGTLPARERAEELGFVMRALENGQRAEANQTIARSLRFIGTSLALAVIDHFRQDSVPDLEVELGLLVPAWRMRLEGPLAARKDFYSLNELGALDGSGKLAELHCAFRARDRDWIRAASHSADLSEDQKAEIKAALKDSASSDFRKAKIRSAKQMVDLASEETSGIVFAARMGRDELLATRLKSVSKMTARRSAEQTTLLRITSDRLAGLVMLVPYLEPDVQHDRLRRLLQEATKGSMIRVELLCLNQLAELGSLTTEEKRTRARIAVELKEEGALSHCIAAAESETDVTKKTALARQALGLLVDAGDSSPDERQNHLISIAFLSEGSADLLNEIIDIASPDGFFEVVDYCLEKVVESESSQLRKLSSFRRWSQFRLNEMKDGQGAFLVLEQAHALYPKSGFSEDAYRLAVESQLVEEQIRMVGVPLAAAGLCAVQREFDRARVYVSEDEDTRESLGGQYLMADIEYAEGFLEKGDAILMRLRDDARAGPELWRNLFYSKKRQAAYGAAIKLALEGLEKFGNIFYFKDDLLECHAGAPVSLQAEFLEKIAHLNRTERLSFAIASDVELEEWLRRANHVGVFDAARVIARTLAVRIDDDAAWGRYLVHVATYCDSNTLWAEFESQYTRQEIWKTLRESCPEALSAALDIPLQGGDVMELMPFLRVEQKRKPLPWILRSRLSVALESGGHSREAADILKDCVPDDRSETASHLLRVAGLRARSGQDQEAIDTLMGVPLSAFDEDARRVVLLLAHQMGSIALPALIRMATALGHDPQDVDEVFRCVDAEITSEMAIAIATWRLEHAPNDERAWRLIMDFGDATACAFFAEMSAVYGESIWPEQLSVQGALVKALRNRDVQTETEHRDLDLLGEARWGEPQQKSMAWQQLAEAAQGDKLFADSARFLARAGVPLHDQPIEIRLAADPVLANPNVRVDAVAHEISALDIATGPEENRLLDLFSELNEQGWAGSAHRERARTKVGGRESLSALIDRFEVGEEIDVAESIRNLGRFASAEQRTVLAALAVKSQQPRWAFFLNPMMQSYQTSRAPMSYIKELQTRAQSAESAGDYKLSLSLYRSTIPVAGTSLSIERKIQDLGAMAESWALVAESIRREICLHESSGKKFERTLVLLDILENQLGDKDRTLRLYRAAAVAFPGEFFLGERWLIFAESTNREHQIIAALRYLESFEQDAEKRCELSLRRSRISRCNLNMPADALSMILKSVDELGPLPLLKMEQVLCFSALGRMEDAGITCMEVLDQLDSDHPYRHQIRRDAAGYFYNVGDYLMAGDLLLLSAREGDRESLGMARDIASREDDLERLEHVYRYWSMFEEDRDRLRELSLERAEFYEIRLDNPGEAIRVLEAQSSKDKNHYGCIEKLARLYLQDKRVLDAGLAYAAAGGIEECTSEERGVALREAACLLAGIGEFDRAGELAERARDHGIEDMMLLTVLSGWYRASERYAELDEVLGAEAELLEQIHDATYPWMERALLRRDVLMDAAGAREALHRILDIVPSHERALDALILDAQRSGEYDGLLLAMEAAVAFSDDETFKSARLQQIADIQAEVHSDYRSALKTLDRLDKPENDRTEILIKRALFFLASGDKKGASEVSNRLRDANATLVPGTLHLLLAEDAILAGDMIEAVRRCRMCLARNECESEAEVLLLRIADEMPVSLDSTDLIAALGEAADRAEPEIDGARAARIYSVAAKYELKQGDADSAAKWASKAVAADPSLMEALELAADAFERTGRFAESELYLRRYGSSGTSDDKRAVLERRARLLEKAGKRKEALRLYMRLLEEGADDSFRKHTVDLAISLGARDVLGRLGVLQQDHAEEEERVYVEPIRDLVIQGKYKQALDRLKDLDAQGIDNGELALQGVIAAKNSNASADFLFFAAKRIQSADDADEIESLYRESGRVARDELEDYDSAVNYLYKAHQVAPDDIELQLEVAELYARMPHLHEHARVGLEQLAKKIPGDYRLYHIASILAQHSLESDKEQAMQTAMDVLSGVAITKKTNFKHLHLAPSGAAEGKNITDLATILSGREKAPQWHLILENIGGLVESRLVRHQVESLPTQPLESASLEYVQAARYLNDRFAGRPIEFGIGDTLATVYEPGTKTKVVIPEELFAAGPDFVWAAMARATFVVRAGFTLGETLLDDDIADFLEHLKFLMGEDGTYELTSLADAGLSAELTGDLIADAQAAAAKNIILRWRRMTRKTADRFSLIASGSMLGSLAAGPYPEALNEAPLMIAAGIKNQARALDLCAYGLSQEPWSLRASWGFSAG
jgi:lipopolysaccharide biosynthesis regulator YciM